MDYTIHVVHRYLAERDEGAPPAEAMGRVSTTTGGALLVSAVTTIVGFGVLVAAPLPAVGQLGFLTALTVALSFLVSLVVLPALLVLGDRTPHGGEVRARPESAAVDVRA